MNPTDYTSLTKSIKSSIIDSYQLDYEILKNKYEGKSGLENSKSSKTVRSNQEVSLVLADMINSAK